MEERPDAGWRRTAERGDSDVGGFGSPGRDSLDRCGTPLVTGSRPVHDGARAERQAQPHSLYPQMWHFMHPSS